MKEPEPEKDWKALGAVAATELTDARLQLHHAAQVPASAGMTFLEPRPDDSHPNLGWTEHLGALLGRTVAGADLQVGLRVEDLALLLVDGAGRIREELPLDGETLAAAYEWLASAMARAGASVPARGVTRSAYEIPPHSVGSGGPFSSASRDALAELSRWFGNGYHALVDVAAHTPGASDVRCWPHHFDLGSLITVAEQPDGSLSQSIGIGLSPGDDSHAEPYWYVSPWPYPHATDLPKLEHGGTWHVDGFTSAVLTGTELLEGAPEGQAGRLRSFLAGAIAASRRALAA